MRHAARRRYRPFAPDVPRSRGCRAPHRHGRGRRRGPRPCGSGGPMFLQSDDPVALAKEHRAWAIARRTVRTRRSSTATRHRHPRRVQGRERRHRRSRRLAQHARSRPAEARREPRYVTERMALAEAVAARCCVDIAGSFNPTVWYGPHPKNLSAEFFDVTVENCRKVIDAVKPTQTTFSIEMMGWSLPDGPDEYLRADQAPSTGRLSPCTWTSATASTRRGGSIATPTSPASASRSSVGGSSRATPRIWRSCRR